MPETTNKKQGVGNAPLGKRKLELYEQTLIALVLGIVTGVFLGDYASVFKVVGDIFIRLLQVTVIPYISLSLIIGLGSLSIDAIKQIAIKGGSILLLLWATAAFLVMLLPLAFPDWLSSSFFSTSLIEETSEPDFLRLFIPSNPFYSYANTIVPAVVVFSILVGIALIGVKDRFTIIDPLSALLQALVKVTGIITKLTPIGVFALIANLVGTIDMEDLMRLQVFTILHALTALILTLWVLPALIATLTPLRFSDVSRSLRTPLVTAFATGSGLIVIPMLIEKCKNLIAETQIVDKERREYADSLVEISITTVYPFPSIGSTLSLFFILFAGWYIGSDISAGSYFTLIAVGIPSLFTGTLISMPFLLDLMQLPHDLFQVFVSIDVITVRFATLVGAMGYATVGLISTMAMLGKLRLHWLELFKFIVISMLMITVVIGSVNAFYTHVVVSSYTKDEVLKSLRFQGNSVPATVFEEIPTELLDNRQAPAGFGEILQRGVLRVCYQPNEYPSAFYNNESPPQLVGLDIAMAHRLASRRQLTLEFFPTNSADEAANRLNAGTCDIYMRSMPVSAGRTQMFALTVPIYTSSIGLIVRDHRRNEFRDWKTVRAAGEMLQIGVEAAGESISTMRDILPDAKLIRIQDMTEQEEILASGADGIDAIVDMAEEGAAWTVLYPSFSIVVPRPTIALPVSYAVARGNSGLLEAVNAWIVTEDAKGTIESLYDYWMLGGAKKVERPPRWSIIRDVLGWVD